MTKQHPGPELEQAGLGCRRRRLRPDAQPLGCPPHQHRLADRLGRRHQRQKSGLSRKSLEPPPEALLDPPRERSPAGESETARQLRRRQPPWQLQQRQGVATRLGDDLVADPLVHGAAEDRVQEQARIALGQTLDHGLGQTRHVLARRTGREYQADRLRPQAARHEPQGLR